MTSRWDTVAVDALDPTRLARWWAEVLGYRLVSEARDAVVIGPEAGPRLVFLRVPEAKNGKNRLHLELRPDDQDAEVERLIDMGARHVDVGPEQAASWVVLADPEGNEFRVLAGGEQ